MTNESTSDRDDLVETQGVNAGSLAADRDRRPSSSPPVQPASGGPTIEGEEPADDELVGAPGQRPGVPGQQMESGEG
jgi:hypothetical protein